MKQMDTHSDQNHARVTKRRSVLLPILGRVLGTVIFILIPAAILIPHFMVSTVARNEINAVESLRTLTVLEHRYAAAHPSKGFACELTQLRPETPLRGERKREEFIANNSSNGYKFELKACEADPNGIAVRYKATAVPLVPEKTGYRAFCTDETGELQDAVNGSAESCRPLTY